MFLEDGGHAPATHNTHPRLHTSARHVRTLQEGSVRLSSLLLAPSPLGSPPDDTLSAVVCRSWAGRKTAAAIRPGQDVKLQPHSVPGRGRVVMRKSLIWNVADKRFKIKLVRLDEV